MYNSGDKVKYKNYNGIFTGIIRYRYKGSEKRYSILWEDGKFSIEDEEELETL